MFRHCLRAAALAAFVWMVFNTTAAADTLVAGSFAVSGLTGLHLDDRSTTGGAFVGERALEGQAGWSASAGTWSMITGEQLDTAFAMTANASPGTWALSDGVVRDVFKLDLDASDPYTFPGVTVAYHFDGTTTSPDVPWQTTYLPKMEFSVTAELNYVWAGAPITAALGASHPAFEYVQGTDAQEFVGTWNIGAVTVDAPSPSQTTTGGPLPYWSLSLGYHARARDTEDVPPPPVPEPATLLLVGSGLVIAGRKALRKRR